MKLVRSLGATLVVALAVSCASPQTVRPQLASDTVAAEEHRQALYVLEQRASDYGRVYSIADRLTRANVEFCPSKHKTIGVRFENLNDYGRDFKTAAQEIWGLSDAASVAWVGTDSPAANAGLRVRDQVVSINGRAITSGRRSSRQALDALRDAADDGDVTMEVRRGSEPLTLRVTPQQDCGYQFVMVDDDAVNAFADGSYVYLPRGMLHFVQNDDELALVLGHELAHNAMGHIQARQQNALMGSIGGALLDVAAAAAGVNTGGAFSNAGSDVGARMFSQDFESEADYVGMYFMARAGYNIDGVENFWRRMSAEHPRSIRLAYTHPTTASRFVGLAATRTEIAQKVANNLPLRPRMRGESAVAIPVTATESNSVSTTSATTDSTTVPPTAAPTEQAPSALQEIASPAPSPSP